MEQSFFDQYQAVRRSAGVWNLSERRKLKAAGADHLQFLQAMVTNDVQNLEALRGRYSALLRPTGKLVADFYYYRFSDHVLIDIESPLARAFRDTVEKLIVMDDVSFEDVSRDWGHLSVQGPRSDDLVRTVLNTPSPDDPLALVEVMWRGTTGWLIRKNHLADKGFEILIAIEHADDLRNELLQPRPDLFPLEIGPEVTDVLRLERGIPRFGVDMTEKNNPIEAGLDIAISFNKGCYVGQEVVSKATYVGGVSRYLRPLAVSAGRKLEADAEVLSDKGKTIGHVTSSAFSPALGQTVALAYIKRAFAEPGCRVRVSSGQEIYDAEVAGRSPRLS